MQFVFLNVLKKRLIAIKYFIKDKKVPIRKKLIILGGILYMLSPIDLVPEPILIFGIMDDIVLWTFIIWYLKDELDKYWLGDEINPSKKYRGKKIIDNVNYEVEEEKKEKEHN